MCWSGSPAVRRSKVFVYDIFLTPATIDDPTQYHSMDWPGPSNDYIYRKANKNSTAGYIQVPADGLYTIELQCGISVGEVYDDDPNAVYTYQKPRHNGEWGEDSGIEYDTILLDATKKNFDWMPVEVQLVRNTDEPELIWTAEDIIKQTTSNPARPRPVSICHLARHWRSRRLMSASGMSIRMHWVR